MYHWSSGDVLEQQREGQPRSISSSLHTGGALFCLLSTGAKKFMTSNIDIICVWIQHHVVKCENEKINSESWGGYGKGHFPRSTGEFWYNAMKTWIKC